MHISYIIKVTGSNAVNKNAAQSDKNLTPQLGALSGTLRKVGEVLIQVVNLALTLPGEEGVGSGVPGELFFLTAAHGRLQEEMFFGRHKKGNLFYQ